MLTAALGSMNNGSGGSGSSGGLCVPQAKEYIRIAMEKETPEE